MSIYIRDKATDAAVRRLAKLKNTTLTGAIREAVENEYWRERKKIPLEQRLEDLAQQFAKFPKSGLEADKAFFDELSGDI